MRRFWLFIATFGFSGYLPLMPGTWGSLATALLVYFVKPYWNAPVYIQVGVIGLIFLLGIPASAKAQIYLDRKDPGQCVIDETVGQMIALLLIPHSVYFYIAGFALFRFFDIRKPCPVRNAEKIGGGLGIMLDDVVAGLYAFGILQVYQLVF